MTSPAAPPAGGPGRVLAHPRLRDGIRLLGAMQDTGFAETQYLLRTADGQFCRLSALLYKVAEASDGTRDHQAIADYVSVAVGKQVSADNVEWLLRERLPWLVDSGASGAEAAPGAEAAGNAGAAPPPARDPLLSLRFRKPIISEQAMNALSTPLKFMFSAPVVLAMFVVGMFANWWLWQISTLEGAIRGTIGHPLGALFSISMFLVGTVFHEIGHSTALKKGGGRPGVMGVGVYLAWPAFYTDVSDSYRLPRWSRVRVDVGGIYFNLIFGMVMCGLAAVTHFEPLIFVAILMEIEAIHQLLPLVRLDGYWILADMLGVPDLFSHIKVHVEGVKKTRKGEAYGRLLRRGPARAFSVYMVTVLPFMLVFIGALVVKAPGIIGLAVREEGRWLGRIGSAALAGNEVGLLTGAVQALLLLLGPLAICLSLGLFLRRALRGIRNFGARSLSRAMLASAASVALVTGLFFAWVPANVRAGLPADIARVARDVGDRIADLQNRDDPTIHRDAGSPAGADGVPAPAPAQ